MRYSSLGEEGESGKGRFDQLWLFGAMGGSGGKLGGGIESAGEGGEGVDQLVNDQLIGP